MWASEPQIPRIPVTVPKISARLLRIRKFLPFLISTASILPAIAVIVHGGQKKWNGAKGCGIDKYLNDKLARFSKTNTVFGRVIDDDLEKLLLLKNGIVINSIEILP